MTVTRRSKRTRTKLSGWQKHKATMVKRPPNMHPEQRAARKRLVGESGMTIAELDEFRAEQKRRFYESQMRREPTNV